MQKHIRNSSPSKKNSEQLLHFNFKLTFEEASEAFLLIIDRRSRISRLAMGMTLLLLALVNVILYALHPYGLQYAMMAFQFAVFSFLVFAYPSIKARFAAKSVVRQGGYFKLMLSTDGYFILPGGDKLRLNGDRHSRVLESNTLFAIRPDKSHTLCLPKRVVRASDISLVRQIFQSSTNTFYDRSLR